VRKKEANKKRKSKTRKRKTRVNSQNHMWICGAVLMSNRIEEQSQKGEYLFALKT
jgi:hypothetical protein